MLAGAKVAAALGCVLAILWLQTRVWRETRLGKRIGIGLLSIALLLPTFALTVSARCDLGQLPDDECQGF